MTVSNTLLPTEAAERNAIPIGDGCLDYFPAALAEVAKVSEAGNRQHNPGQPLGWSRWKSTNHWDKVIRHGLERGSLDLDGLRHSAKMAWRALAILQEELEAAGAPPSRGSRFQIMSAAEKAPANQKLPDPLVRQVGIEPGEEYCACAECAATKSQGMASAIRASKGY